MGCGRSGEDRYELQLANFTIVSQTDYSAGSGNNGDVGNVPLSIPASASEPRLEGRPPNN